MTPKSFSARLLGFVDYRLQPLVQPWVKSWFHWRNGTRDRLVIVVGSSHRVGSTWLWEMLSELFYCPKSGDGLPDVIRQFTLIVLNPAGYDYLRHLRGPHLFKTHSLPPTNATEAQSARFVTVTRDPRDQLVSACFYLAYLDPARGGLGESFRALPFPDRLQHLLNDSSEGERYLQEAEDWFATPYAIRLRYENLRRDPRTELQSLAQQLGLTVDRATMARVVRLYAFERRSGRPAGKEDRDQFMRKGIVGDWRNYFDDAGILAFKQAHDGRWNRLLVAMGYEPTLDW